MAAVFLTRDLVFLWRAATAGRAAGIVLRSAGDAAAFLRACEEIAPCLALVDLDAAGGELPALVRAVRALDHRPALVAYAPHVRRELLQGARDAGCDLVLTRGQFHDRLEPLLAAAARGEPLIPPGSSAPA
jgi:DNA-binding NarL/FixJ family response regulator